MHMSDALISTGVGATMWAASGGVGYLSSSKINKMLETNKVPLMGVMGAFVFAAQMINFTIPGTGSSGHIGGGILLAALLGPNAGFVTLAAVLLIQALFFGDGGLLAYGCNLFNMGFFTCYVAYPLIFKPLLKKGISRFRLIFASVLTVVAGLQLGAFAVVLETVLSGKTELPFGTFVWMMQPIHLLIGLVEGFVTAAILSFLWQARPEIIDIASQPSKTGSKGIKEILMIMAVLSLLVGGVGSLLASSNPDGLEWAMLHTAGTAELSSDSPVHEFFEKIQEKTAILPDYGFQNGNEESAALGTSVSGIAGMGLTLVVLAGFGVLSHRKRRTGSAERKK